MPDLHVCLFWFSGYGLKQCWFEKLSAPPTAAAVVDGRVYVNTLGQTGSNEGGNIYAFDVWTGERKWQFMGENVLDKALATEGTLTSLPW